MLKHTDMWKMILIIWVFLLPFTETCKTSIWNPTSESNRHEWWRKSQRVPFGGEEETVWTIQGEVLIITASECWILNGGVERVKKCTRSDILSIGIHEISSCIQKNLNVILSVLLSNTNPVCSLPSFVSSTLQPFTAGRKITHVRHTLDQLTALYCHCLLCYLFKQQKQQKNWSSVLWKLIDN